MSTSSDFNRLARAWLEEGPASLSDRALEAALEEVHVTRQRRVLRAPWRPLNMPAFTRASAVAAMALVLVVGGGAIWYAGQRTHPSPPTSADSPAPTPASSAARSPAASPSEKVGGWPATSANGPGLYSWGSGACASSNCAYGFMHNGNSSADVAITIRAIPEPPVAPGASAATIAGHTGLYRPNVDADPSTDIAGLGRLEEWIVDIDGTSVMITLYAEPYTTDGHLAEAHAIIESMRYEPQTNPLGFRLVFRIVTSDWDSG
jgi:hypothetical protein